MTTLSVYRLFSIADFDGIRNYIEELPEEKIIDKLIIDSALEFYSQNYRKIKSNIIEINKLLKQYNESLSKTQELAVALMQDFEKIRNNIFNHTKEYDGSNIQGIIDSLGDEDFIASYYWIIQYYALMSNLHHNPVEFDKGLEYLRKAKDVADKAGDKVFTAILLNDIGGFQLDTGNLIEGEQNIRKSIDLAMSQEGAALCCQYGNLSDLHLMRGELDKAADFGEEALSIIKDRCTLAAYACYKEILAGTYVKQGKLSSAKELYTEAIEDRRSLGIYGGVAYNLYKLVETSILEENHKNAQYYYDQLIDLDKEVNFWFIKMRQKLALAVILKNSKKLRDKIHAQDLYREVLEIEQIGFWTRIMCYLNLCELLIYELKTSEDEEIFEELNMIISKILDDSEKNQLLNLKAEILGIMASIKVIEGELDEAMTLFEKGKQIAEKFGFKRVWDELDKHERQFLDKFTQWKNIVSTHTSIGKRLEYMNIESYIAQAIKLQSQSEKFLE
jgi:tetratricopeptide (TPR) repeat protein